MKQGLLALLFGCFPKKLKIIQLPTKHFKLSIIFEIHTDSYICDMQLEEAKEKFIQAWGALGSNLGN